MITMLDKKQIKAAISASLGLEVIQLHLLIDMLETCSTTTLEDFKLYIDALEQYSSELDKTLADIFEQAKIMAEEQQKQREEIMKRKSPESYIK